MTVMPTLWEDANLIGATRRIITHETALVFASTKDIDRFFHGLATESIGTLANEREIFLTGLKLEQPGNTAVQFYLKDKPYLKFDQIVGWVDAKKLTV